ncbi:ABC transporter permease [Aquisphaera insulae]|uniref:ABC transporter permease n=1 Tax=Aquisphaera insulae TaxID=2712864 RepID=UPI0013EE2A2D|nr:ABC transporter permease subunit [Aquisphaera insulae]
MSRLGSAVVSCLVLAAVAALVAFPIAATLFEAGGPRRAEALLRSAGLTTWADRIRETWPDEPQPDTGKVLDPAAAAKVIEDSGATPRWLRLACETLTLVTATELLTLPAGVLLAMVLFRIDAPFRGMLLSMLVIALFVPLPLHATAWLGAFGNAGRSQYLGLRPFLTGRSGAAIVHALAVLPWVVLIVGIGLRTVESDLEQTASLDMSPRRVAWNVTLRRSLGAIAAAALAVAVLTAGDMTVTDLLQIRTYAEESYIRFTLGHGPAEAAFVALPPFVVLSVAILALGLALQRADPARLAAAFARPDRWQAGRWRAGLGACLLAACGGIALPLCSLVWRAGRVGGAARLGLPPTWSLGGLRGSLRFALDECRGPIGTSLWLAGTAATIATALAWCLAWKSRGSRAWLWLLLTVAAVTLATPGPVAGMAIGLAYRWFSSIYDTAAILVLAQVFRTLPYAILIAWTSIRILPVDLLDAAAVDGLSPAGVVRRVAVPLTLWAILSAWLASFVLAFGELPATNLLQPPGVTTITFVIWSLLHTGVESHLAAVALVTLAVIAGILVGVAGLFRTAGPVRRWIRPRR